jgi:hypothetical protein
MRTLAWTKQTIVAVLIGVLGSTASQTVQGRQAGEDDRPSGQVRLAGRAVVDADGPFNALGATLFWGAWGYKFDRARLERNLESLRSAGVDYIRVLGAVGGRGWEDRETDPRWTDYDDVVGGLTDLAYDRYGMRVQWTIFGGSPTTPTGAAREALVDRFAALAKGREHKIFAFEIANEARSNGFEGSQGLAELRQLGKRLHDRTSVLVALSAPGNGAACATYAGAIADVATIHYDRGLGSNGALSPIFRPWGYPTEFDRDCPGRLPTAVFNNEPIGPESSVRSEDDPGHIVAGYVMTFVSGNAAYVLHAGPGIRGGGDADVEGKYQRHANFDEVQAFDAIAAGLRAAKGYLPQGVANWTQRGPGSAIAPIAANVDMYTATSRDTFVALAIGGDRPITFQSRAAATVDVRQASTGRVLRNIGLKVGDRFTVNDPEPLILIGRMDSP